MLADMDVRLKIADMEKRLGQRNISVARVCRDAEVAQTSWGRWKNGTDAREKTWLRVEAAFGRLIRVEEIAA
jgi:hypothetical protein